MPIFGFGEYEGPGGGFSLASARYAFFHQLDLHASEALTQLIASCNSYVDLSITGQLEVDLATGAATELVAAINAWQKDWHLSSEGADDWIFNTAVETLVYNQMLNADRATWKIPAFAAYHYVHEDIFAAQVNLSFETRSGARERLRQSFNVFLEQFLDEAQDMALAQGAQKVPNLRNRDTTPTQRLEWLVLHQVLGQRYQQIYDKVVLENDHFTLDSVRKAIGATASLISLNLTDRN